MADSPAEVVAAAMPTWSNRAWLARQAIKALQAGGYSIVRREYDADDQGWGI